MKLGILNGEIVYLSGANHPQWKGGVKASVQRRIASGKAREYNRLYRKRNPERVREWSAKRGKAKAQTGRLPKGTVKRILKLQRHKCAICMSKLAGYHIDHIYPLSKGGKHISKNIQILCSTCNVRKNAKDPIQHMQELGFLL